MMGEAKNYIQGDMGGDCLGGGEAADKDEL